MLVFFQTNDWYLPSHNPFPLLYYRWISRPVQETKLSAMFFIGSWPRSTPETPSIAWSHSSFQTSAQKWACDPILAKRMRGELSFGCGRGQPRSAGSAPRSYHVFIVWEWPWVGKRLSLEHLTTCREEANTGGWSQGGGGNPEDRKSLQLCGPARTLQSAIRQYNNLPSCARRVFVKIIPI